MLNKYESAQLKTLVSMLMISADGASLGLSDFKGNKQTILKEDWPAEILLRLEPHSIKVYLPVAHPDPVAANKGAEEA